ncbi:MAG: ParB N-terminal domain-containing protein [bacterium]
MLADLPNLKIVPTASIHLHEEFDEQRAVGLGAKMRKAGILTNPPIVAAIPRKREYVVLDGANRVTAAARIRLPTLLVQLVDYDDAEIVLSNWAHVVRGFPAAKFFSEAQALYGARIDAAPFADARRELANRRISCFFHHKDRGTFVLRRVTTRGSDATEVKALRDITGIYKDRASIVRIPLTAENAKDLAVYDGFVVAFPTFSKADIVRCAVRPDDRLPTGISRHTIPLRALRVNLPLSVLRSSKPLTEKNRILDAFIARKARTSSIRLYNEPTFIYDD